MKFNYGQTDRRFSNRPVLLRAAKNGRLKMQSDKKISKDLLILFHTGLFRVPKNKDITRSQYIACPTDTGHKLCKKINSIEPTIKSSLSTGIYI